LEAQVDEEEKEEELWGRSIVEINYKFEYVDDAVNQCPYEG
jgi:hypothetical protein